MSQGEKVANEVAKGQSKDSLVHHGKDVGFYSVMKSCERDLSRPNLSNVCKRIHTAAVQRLAEESGGIRTQIGGYG